MVENKKKSVRPALSSRMTEEEAKEYMELDADNPDVEEYEKRLANFYKKHNFRSARIEEKWEAETENY